MYVASLHWSLTQFSPATSNISPVNVQERLFGAAVVLFALGILTSLLSSVAAHTTEIRALSARRSSAETQLLKFFMVRKVSRKLGSRIISFMNNANKRYVGITHEDDLPLLKQMPQSLQIKLHAELYMPLMHASDIFSWIVDLDKSLLVRICHVAFKEKTFPPWFDVFVDNTTADGALYSLNGKSTYHQVSNDIFARAHMSTTGQGTRLSAASTKSRLSYEGNDKSALAPGTWICEMALWSEWQHCGMLLSESSLDMATLDAELLREVCTEHNAATSVILKKLAILAVAHVEQAQKDGDKISDLGFGPVIWNQLMYRAQMFRDAELKDILGA